MIPWDTLQQGVLALWRTQTGIRDITWTGTSGPEPGQTNGFVAAGDAFVQAEVMALSNTSVGVLDALTWAEASPDGPLLQTATGQRELVLRTKVTVLDQRAPNVARWYLEKLRDCMPFDSVRDALAELNLGFCEALTLNDLSAAKKIDQRIQSIGSLDIRFNLTTRTTDATEYSRIASVTLAPTYSS